MSNSSFADGGKRWLWSRLEWTITALPDDGSAWSEKEEEKRYWSSHARVREEENEVEDLNDVGVGRDDDLVG